MQGPTTTMRQPTAVSPPSRKLQKQSERAPCEELLLGKAHIPRSSQVRGLSKLATYSISVMDGQRTRIMKEDLCDHVWEFRFNEAAPEYWRNLDPYWKGTGPPMRRYFHPDGSLTADPGDEGMKRNIKVES
ncbi:hypothetical protein RHMOL_Rhmol09G0052200 [Rhododendron molle]|uniref:Uncharacterized protein n=1 Tax=Rhododendron molle TaxID=49168 RepID=A0ACC0MA22_RHOML|nr:hypothetical protein RHMOL_Rhmol09G0052200 [Rhododendron molle]